MFITLKFGDDEQLFFNPDCIVQLLIDDVKKKCRLEKHVDIDLIHQNGDLVGLADHAMENGCSLFLNRGVYILIQLQRIDSDAVKYVPLLSGIGELYPDILVRLDALSNPKGRPESRNFGKGRRGITKPSQVPKKKISGGDNKSKSRLK